MSTLNQRGTTSYRGPHVVLTRAEAQRCIAALREMDPDHPETKAIEAKLRRADEPQMQPMREPLP